MAKKRKSDASRLDEVDRTMYTTFCSAANSLSQLYTHAMNQQRLSFQAGERHSLEKLYQWILRQQEEGARVTTTEIVSYLQHELECGDESPMSPRVPLQHSQMAMHHMISGLPVSSNSLGPAAIGQGTRSGYLDHQGKNSVFSNALSSPVRRNLQPFHLSQGSYNANNSVPYGNGPCNNESNSSQNPNRESSSPRSFDCSMDMHADSPGNEYPN
ncbi:hypothetical protein RJ641_010375 [Dillenia turbinata]|uniref:Holocarboxylase synthetase n=1 Tax=Dillenia turbinata TaxID=194707 RepID=A0AAN8UY79_9MAGN